MVDEQTESAAPHHQAVIENFIQEESPYWTLVDLEDPENENFTLGTLWHVSEEGTIYLEYDADCASFSWVKRSRDWLEKREENRNVVIKKLDHFYERFFVSNSRGYVRQVSIMNS